jgi:hypothetical protein
VNGLHLTIDHKKSDHWPKIEEVDELEVQEGDI